jgi:eukaryotic-like serine/threonine-protein kinase
VSQTFESFGKYVLLEKLATGGMAEVYLAKSSGANGVGKFFAVKRILPQFSESQEFIDMFKDEAKLVSNLQHSNIVSLYEFGVEKTQFFIVMEYIDGRNLRQILNKMKKQGVMFSTEQVLFIIREIAAGLDHAHRSLDKQTGKPLNIIHRDMSPQNVMVSFEGENKIVDFGIAKAETQVETTRAGTLKGKFGYMSPEQAEGQTLDVRTDVFSLGILLWELLANDRLFVSNNEINTLRKIRDCQIPSLRKINPNINPELERIVTKTLAKDRNFRYQTAAALQRDLNKFMNRSYPDFSPHDFSLFVKNLFQQEILESRRKQIEYARADIRITTAELPQAPKSPPTLAEIESASDEPSISKEAADFGNSRFLKSALEAPGASRTTKANETPTLSPRAKGFATSNTSPGSKPNSGQSPQRDPSRRPLDGATQFKVEATSTSGGGSYYVSSQTNGSFRTSTQYRNSKKSAGSWFTTLALIFLLGSGAGAFLWYQSNPIRSTQIVQNLLKDYGLVAKTQSREDDQRDLSSEAQPTTRLIIKTTPGGAEIFLDGKPTGEVSPATLNIVEGRPVVLSLRHRNQEVYRENINPSKNDIIVSRSIRPQGYLDIVVIGSGEIYVQGKLITKSPPARGVAVPADEEVVVRAFDPITQTVAEERVRVPANETRMIQLRPTVGLKRMPAKN